MELIREINRHAEHDSHHGGRHERSAGGAVRNRLVFLGDGKLVGEAE